MTADYILITHSESHIVPSGKVYSVVKKKGQPYIYNTLGHRTLLNEETFQWRKMDKVVMLIRVVSSRVIDTLIVGQIYRVFDDKKDDERYVIDESGEMILFDNNIFQWEVI